MGERTKKNGGRRRGRKGRKGKGANSGERRNYPYSFQLWVLPRGQPGIVSESRIHDPCPSKGRWETDKGRIEWRTRKRALDRKGRKMKHSWKTIFCSNSASSFDLPVRNQMGLSEVITKYLLILY